MTEPGLASPDATSRWRAAVALASLAVLAFHAPLLDGGVPSGFDVVEEKLFWRTWTFDRLRHGDLPSWNPHVLCGYPMHADPVQAVFYPLEWVHLVLPHPLAIGVSLTVAGLVACWGTMRLARFLGADPWGSALAGVAYATSGLVAGHIGLGEVPHLQAMGWSPWCISLALEALAGRRRPLLALPLVIASTVLAGHVQYAYQTLVGTAIACVTALAWMTPPALVARRLVARVAPAMVLGLLMAAIGLVPALAYVRDSNRGGGLDWMASTTGAIHPFELLRMVVPAFFGDAVTTPYWGGFIQQMATPYVGIATLVVAPWGLRSRRRPGALALVPMALFGLGIALSAYTPLHRWVFHVLPGFAFFRMPVRWLHLTTLGLAVAGGLGLSALASRPPGQRWRPRDWARAAVLPAALTALVLAVFTPGDARPPSRFARLETGLRSRVDSFLGPEPDAIQPGFSAARPQRLAAARAATMRALALAAISVGGLAALARRPPLFGPLGVALVSLDLLASGHPYVGTVPPGSLETPLPLRSLLASEPLARSLTLVPGTIVPRPAAFEQSYPGFNRFSQSYIHRAMVEGRRDVGGIFFVVSSRYRTLVGVSSSFEHETVEDRAILDLLSVRWVLAPAGSWPSARLAESDFIPRAESHGVRVLENPRWRPRVFLARSIEVSADAEQARTRLTAPDFPRDGLVVLADDLDAAGVSPASITSLAAGDGTARITEEQDDRLSIRVESTRAAVVVIADAYDAGWRATVDGVDAPVLPADLALRAVPVPAGSHEVVLAYRPPPLLHGAALTTLGIVAWLGLWWRVRRDEAAARS